MKKNDKMVVIFGVIMLILASIGIIYYDVDETNEIKVDINSIPYDKISGKLIMQPDAISVSEGNTFYPLIATPLATHYDEDGSKQVKPGSNHTIQHGFKKNIGKESVWNDSFPG